MNYARRAARVLAPAIVCLSGAFVTHAQAPSLEGTYAIVPERSSNIDEAIANAVAKMNFITRSVARGRLKKTNPAYQRISISRSESQIEVKFDDRKPIAMPADGSVVKWTREDGEVFDVSAQWQDSTLIQTFKAEDGERTNTFHLGASGAELTLDVVIKSARLTEPLTYTLAYQRT